MNVTNLLTRNLLTTRLLTPPGNVSWVLISCRAFCLLVTSLVIIPLRVVQTQNKAKHNGLTALSEASVSRREKEWSHLLCRRLHISVGHDHRPDAKQYSTNDLCSHLSEFETKRIRGSEWRVAMGAVCWVTLDAMCLATMGAVCWLPFNVSLTGFTVNYEIGKSFPGCVKEVETLTLNIDGTISWA